MSPKPYGCACSATFHTGIELEHHLMQVAEISGHERIEYACVCGFISVRSDNLGKHIEMMGSPAHRRDFSNENSKLRSSEPRIGPEVPTVTDVIRPKPSSDFLDRLREINLARAVKFGHGDPSEWNELDPMTREGSWGPMQWGCALAGEVGELCNVLKKFERQLPTDPKPDELEAMIGKEIADVLIYLDLLASIFSINLRHVTALKFNEVSKRQQMLERLDP
jgi:NTP pyrophosphatase (non-canonical NTP hydrolase)